MGFEIQVYQLFTLVFWCIILFIVFLSRASRWFKVVFILIGLALFLVNPIRFSAPTGAFLEGGGRNFNIIPDKVVVDRPSFKQRQQTEMSTLKSQSEGMKNDIHN